jgi:hypothetical protein
MSIVGWKSPLDGKVYALDDFEPLNRVIPEPVLRAMTRKVELDTRHRGPNITITSGLSCPRKTLISRALPYAPDPTKMWKMHRGTWLHECVGLSLAENDAWITEESDPDACTFEGELFGIKMSCRVDAYKKDHSTLVDWKFRGDGAEKWVDPMGRAKDEDSAQLNMARMLMEQTFDADLSEMEMYVWVMSGQTVRTTVPLMSEEQLGAIRPGSTKYKTCDFTIREIFTLLKAGMDKWQALGGEGDTVGVEDIRETVHALPMVGQSMYVGRSGQTNMCTNYCELQDECYACEGGI